MALKMHQKKGKVSATIHFCVNFAPILKVFKLVVGFFVAVKNAINIRLHAFALLGVSLIMAPESIKMGDVDGRRTAHIYWHAQKKRTGKRVPTLDVKRLVPKLTSFYLVFAIMLQPFLSLAGSLKVEAAAVTTRCAYADVAIVIDHSTSVSASLAQEQADAANLINKFATSDYSAAIAANGSAIVAKSLSSDHGATISAINLLTASGYTNIGDAIASAAGVLTTGRNSSVVKKNIVILTDGRINNSPTTIPGNDSLVNTIAQSYTETKAAAAKNSGTQISVIRYGTDGNDFVDGLIDANLLAVSSGSNYYKKDPSSTDLQSIFDLIAQNQCGSLNGHKYRDANNDGIIADAEKSMVLSGWDIVLNGPDGSSQTSTTDSNGAYGFANLVAGDYTVSEGTNASRIPFTQTYPANKIYSFTLAIGQQKTDIDFANADSSMCDQIDTPAQCTRDGYRKHIISYPYLYCGANTETEVADATCTCAASETSRQCSGNATTTANYHYNFNYCSIDYSAEITDHACDSQYSCAEWTNTQCSADGIMPQTRTCSDQYQNTYPENRNNNDQSCACVRSSAKGECVSDGKTNMSYSWNFGYCGQSYTATEDDTACVCAYSDWVNGVCASDGFRNQARTQTTSFIYCTALSQAVSDSTCTTNHNNSNNNFGDNHQKNDTNNNIVSGYAGQYQVTKVIFPRVLGDATSTPDLAPTAATSTASGGVSKQSLNEIASQISDINNRVTQLQTEVDRFLAANRSNGTQNGRLPIAAAPAMIASVKSDDNGITPAPADPLPKVAQTNQNASKPVVLVARKNNLLAGFVNALHNFLTF
jgi:outer membrane murein-binding lipoprotein Lpp/Mg-chelatase subunit ChlD